MYTRSHTTIAVPPGATIKEQLEDRGMKQKEFAIRMDLSEKHVSKLINGEVQLTADVAHRLQIVLGIPAEYWNNLEALYRDDLIKIELENTLDSDKKIAKCFPYRQMAEYGWVPKTNDAKERVANLRSYFEVVSLDILANANLTNIVCRRLKITEQGDLALMAWAQHIKLEARDVQADAFNSKELKRAISTIRAMSLKSPDVFLPELKEILRKCGVILVLSPHLPGSYLQGATFMNDNHPIIGMTTRGKDADKFWFSLFHELAHILLDHIKQPEEMTKQRETEADAYAQEQLIPNESYRAFLKKKVYTAQSIQRFAKEIGIASGIVVGRMQNDGILKHQEMNSLKESYDFAR